MYFCKFRKVLLVPTFRRKTHVPYYLLQSNSIIGNKLNLSNIDQYCHNWSILGLRKIAVQAVVHCHVHMIQLHVHSSLSRSDSDFSSSKFTALNLFEY